MELYGYVFSLAFLVVAEGAVSGGRGARHCGLLPFTGHLHRKLLRPRFPVGHRNAHLSFGVLMGEGQADFSLCVALYF